MTPPENSNKHIGSSFDDFLDEEGIAAEVVGQAVREIIAHLVARQMAETSVTKTEMAARMHTNRQALARLLNPSGGMLMLDAFEQATGAVGEWVRISFNDAAREKWTENSVGHENTSTVQRR